MSLRKVLSLTRTAFRSTAAVQSKFYTRQNICLLFANSARFFSDKNLGQENKSESLPEKVDIIGRLFPKSSASSDDAQEIKKEQERFEQENKEKTEENEKVGEGFAVFGGAVTVMGGLVVEMGAPRRSDDGTIIEDEYSDLPIVLQWDAHGKNLHSMRKFKKRPGVDQFLQAVSSANFEIVVFTYENFFMIMPVLDKLDPQQQYISYKLFRDSTHFIDGEHVKNLEGINRDLSKVIVVDWNKRAVKFHPQNSLILKKWKGNDDDTTLLDLASFLQAISMSNISDVREVLTYYSQFDDPIAAFRENQRKLMEQMEEKERETKNADQPLTRNWLKSFTRR